MHREELVEPAYPPGAKRTLHEAAHKLDVKASEEIAAKLLTDRPPAHKAIFNEAAHRLGYWGAPDPGRQGARVRGPAPRLRTSRKGLFIAMARNAASPIDHFGLPSDRTVMMGSQIAL